MCAPSAAAVADAVLAGGQNDFGQLSLGNTEDVFAPLSIKESEESIKLVGCGGHHLVLVSEQGAVFVAGRNDKRQLGVAASFDKQSIPLLLVRAPAPADDRARSPPAERGG
jgi:alpha-tubulin suppressor-like RCC1 family protein